MAEPAKLGAHEIRRRFIAFFEARQHTFVPSSSLVPQNDPTLLFVNAGMVQFKDVFTGRESRPYTRAVTVQRCVRAGGKHNDLDNVGFTPRHHTLFEMLGNFSFGDYFKRDAIRWGWEFLTGPVSEGGLGIPGRRLCVTVFSGEGEDAPPDDEAVEFWTEFVPVQRIYRCDAKENFWMMGDTGPCGPCSEIHYYKGGDAPGDAGTAGKGPAHEEDSYMELWNLVFMQYEKRADGTMVPLPKPSVDTGAGLERVAATVAGVSSNYETGLLAPLVAEAKRLAGRSPERVGDTKGEAPFRVIADHARAAAFLISDGVFPDRAGREYVLRRIMRRAIRHGTEVGLDEPFMHVVCQRVVDEFGEHYPELHARAATIQEVVRGEEIAFRRTLSRGLRRLSGAIEALDAERKEFPPDTAAELYDTYGFPLDLTRIICSERGLTLDEARAAKVLQERQDGGETQLGSARRVDDLYFRVHDNVGDSEFLGYDITEATEPVVVVLVEGQSATEASAGTRVEMVFGRTPFYAESGGQIGDGGSLEADGVRIEVSQTIKPVGTMHVHQGTVIQGTVRVGQQLRLTVDAPRRDAIRRNHSATHLLHHALREVLGEHVTQKGSLVAPDRLRFDFSHNRSLTLEQRHEIERRVNLEVVANEVSQSRVMTMDAAKEAGATMLFGEQYGDRVRVVNIGRESVELCGGTHVARTGDIGLFTIVGEGSIAQGVRRIEAVTGMGAVSHVQAMTDTIQAFQAELRAGSLSELPVRLQRLQTEFRDKERTIEALQRKLATGGSRAIDAVEEVEGIKLFAKKVPVANAKALRQAADEIRNRLGSGVVVLGAESEGKATLLVAVTKDLAGRLHAGKLVGQLASHVDGKGGGRPDMAQAGGPSAAGLDAAIEAARGAVARQLAGS